MNTIWLRSFKLSLLLIACMPASALAQSFVGSKQCEACHEQAYASWTESHHYQAMLPATPENVAGNFSDQTFEYGGVTSRFYRKGGKYFVETDNRLGELQEFEIAYTFGFYPLQQYLVPFEDGRLQALSIVWDSRPQSQGGQRWIHLYPGEPVTHEDAVHWTGSLQNWNSRCAVCHSTGLEKNYSGTTDRYNTSWEEVNVACEACHGPASGHVDWTTGDQQEAGRGFSFSLADSGAFAPVGDHSSGTMRRVDGKQPTVQVETCAACHSRRSEIAHYQAGQPFNDQYRLTLVEPGMYFPDGQINDEVYVYGSFIQSKMHQAGVVCTNCHDPHSNRLLANDNSLCAQCHSASVFDRPEHHHHAADNAGSACVNCHMPAKTYMVVDDRRDHSFRIPEPRLTLALGVPNSCNQCHQDQDAQWAADALASWGVSRDVRAGHAAILNAAWSGQPGALPGLLALANQPAQPAMLRASAILAAQNYPSQEALAGIQQLLLTEDPLLKASAVRAMDWVPEAQRYAMLRDLISDKSRAVRLAVARQLSGIPADQLPPASAAELKTLWQEYLESLQLNADMPEDQMNLGLFFSSTGDMVAAEKAYRRALQLAPAYVPAMLNLADLYRANGLDPQAEPLLLRAIKMAPGQASVQHAMGLLRIRQGDMAKALPHLEIAARDVPINARYNYVYSVALWEAGKRGQAVTNLESVLQTYPGDRDLVSALASYYQQLGEVEKLRLLQERYAPAN
ncbi:MAG: tetratricopeptide repeat protein [Xanthomonadales bacterium]|nr:tetratricopeptide repeat protein [Gammaproteobacteria bacterium]MBT8053078.1 tetratricopeptide repeat protein [Gammaproteobacteria bacterium]NND56678.1 tetratricopeptide repeat protein [Xanthomonadales bacterium]NNK52663.1 tetratricopeptide repeat protein [Xanthomonadales bacterium]